MTTLGTIGVDRAAGLAARYAVELILVTEGAPIPASYWGESEAGLRGRQLFARADTPLHSVLHELAHYVCMDEARRSVLDCDAGGDYAEEDAVCYLQILLADHVEGSDRARMCRDMDAWGYTFRLGSACAWFCSDAEDAARWLAVAGVIGADGRPTWRCRTSAPAPTGG
ncbi:MAG TPA: hypothetical protein VLT59_11580, partial [Steroidobacteraceae bacterium]|nr:hypothetical protein [Steroidobacteraceae bacterium]